MKRLEAALAAGYHWWTNSALNANARRQKRLERRLPNAGPQIATLKTGGKLICDLAIPYDRSGYLEKQEVTELRLISRLLREGDVFVDCGANIGLFTVSGAHLVGPAGRVFACEPVANTLTRLEEDCALNEFGDSVSSLKSALAAESGIEVVLTREAHNVMRVDAESASAGEVATTTTVDSIRETSTNVAGLKIDVEGYELDVLRGGEETIRRFSPWMLIKFNSDFAGTRELRNWDVHTLLTERGYRAQLRRAVLAGKRASLSDSWLNPGHYWNLFCYHGEIPATA